MNYKLGIKYFVYSLIFIFLFVLTITLTNYISVFIVFIPIIAISLAITYVYMKKRGANQFKRLGEKVPEKVLKKMEKKGDIEKVNGKSNIQDRI